MYRKKISPNPYKELKRRGRIVCRDSPSKSLRIFELNTITYGHAVAPYLAIRFLLKLKNQIESRKSEIAKIVKMMFLLDLLTGADNIGETDYTCHNFSRVLKTACFELR